MEFIIWTMEFPLWTMEFPLWTMELGVWTMELGVWTMVCFNTDSYYIYISLTINRNMFLTHGNKYPRDFFVLFFFIIFICNNFPKSHYKNICKNL